MKYTGFLVLVLVLLVLVTSNQMVVGQTSDTTLEVARVVRVVDGDTIDVDLNNSRVRIRYIGINTPEINESCGDTAAQANAALVQGKTVTMFRDVSDTDSYGRLLRYVFVDGTFVNAVLVANGWAEAVKYPPDTTFAGYFEALEANAAAANKGCHAFGAFAGAATVISPTPTPLAGVTITVSNNINLRSGPGTNYPIVGTLGVGRTAQAVGRNGDWLVLANNMWIAGWLVTAQGNVSSLPARPAPAAPAGARAAAPAAPAQSAQPVQPPAPAFVCDCSKTCPQMSSCEEAYFQLQQCGCKKRDGDGDGVPCEEICPGG